MIEIHCVLHSDTAFVCLRLLATALHAMLHHVFGHIESLNSLIHHVLIAVMLTLPLNWQHLLHLFLFAFFVFIVLCFLLRIVFTSTSMVVSIVCARISSGQSPTCQRCLVGHGGHSYTVRISAFHTSSKILLAFWIVIIVVHILHLLSVLWSWDSGRCKGTVVL